MLQSSRCSLAANGDARKTRRRVSSRSRRKSRMKSAEVKAAIGRSIGSPRTHTQGPVVLGSLYHSKPGSETVSNRSHSIALLLLFSLFVDVDVDTAIRISLFAFPVPLLHRWIPSCPPPPLRCVCPHLILRCTRGAQRTHRISYQQGSVLRVNPFSPAIAPHSCAANLLRAPVPRHPSFRLVRCRSTHSRPSCPAPAPRLHPHPPDFHPPPTDAIPPRPSQSVLFEFVLRRCLASPRAFELKLSPLPALLLHLSCTLPRAPLGLDPAKQKKGSSLLVSSPRIDPIRCPACPADPLSFVRDNLAGNRRLLLAHLRDFLDQFPLGPPIPHPPSPSHPIHARSFIPTSFHSFHPLLSVFHSSTTSTLGAGSWQLHPTTTRFLVPSTHRSCGINTSRWPIPFDQIQRRERRRSR